MPTLLKSTAKVTLVTKGFPVNKRHSVGVLNRWDADSQMTVSRRQLKWLPFVSLCSVHSVNQLARSLQKEASWFIWRCASSYSFSRNSWLLCDERRLILRFFAKVKHCLKNNFLQHSSSTASPKSALLQMRPPSSITKINFLGVFSFKLKLSYSTDDSLVMSSSLRSPQHPVGLIRANKLWQVN